MSDLIATPALEGFSRSWTDFSIEELVDYELVLLTIAQGQDTNFTKCFKKHLKSDLPAPGQIRPAEGGSSMWLEPGKYLVMLGRCDVNADKVLAAAFGENAYTVLLSDGWACLRVEGKQTLDVFERFIPLNLRQAPIDYATRTSAHHISVIITSLLDGSYLLLTPRSSARSFLEALTRITENVLS